MFLLGKAKRTINHIIQIYGTKLINIYYHDLFISCSLLTLIANDGKNIHNE